MICRKGRALCMKNICNLNSLNRKMKEYEGGRCMMVKKSYDVSTAFYRRGREKAPAVDWHIKGEFEVSLLRAVLVLVSVLTFLAAAGMMCRSALYCLMTKKFRRKYKSKKNSGNA